MSDTFYILYLAITVGVGAILFYAAREIYRGIREATREHYARASPGQDGQSSNSRSTEDDPPKAAQGEVERWYTVLDVPATASLDEIKAAYRRMIALYHPDRVNGMGDELRSLAEHRTKQINAAYEAARRAAP